MNRPDENHELIRRYREASAQDERRPSVQVREAVRAHAKMVLASKAAGPSPSPAPAANQSRWKISLLASIALAGLTGLLVLQFDRGTEDEQETALGRPAPAVSPPPPASPPPAAADARSEAPVARPAMPAPAPKAASRPAQPAPDVGTAAPAAASPPRPAEPAPASPSAQPPLAQQAPALARERAVDMARDQSSEKATAPAAPEAMTRSAAAPALRLPAPAPAQQNLGAQAPRSATALAAALHQAARAGQVGEAEALLQQGAALNTPDSAGRTALVLAVIHGHSELARRLLALGANPALVDREGLDALQHARRLGREELVQMLEARS
jgi:hypothetical protein